MFDDYFRGVIYERPGDEHVPDGKRKYIIAGVLITDDILPNSTTGARGVVDGLTPGLAVTLAACPKKHVTLNLGDISDIITSMKWWEFEEDQPQWDDDGYIIPR